jgi:hypothetical protein
MKRNKKIIPIQTLIVEPSPTMKRLGYFLAIMGFLCAIVLIPDMKLDNIKGDAAPILIIVLILLMWVFIYLPYKAITTKKRLIINGDKFILKSNKKGQSISTNINNMIWWRKIAPSPGLMDISNKIQINFKSKKIMLDALEFQKFYELESFFETNFKEKEKKASR